MTHVSRFRWVLVSVVAVGMIVAAVALGSDRAAGSDRVLELDAGSAGAMATCLPFDVETLAGMPLAFKGAVTEVDGSVVTLSVEEWYTGGDASLVTLIGEHQSPALITGFEFELGSDYLISATNGEVNYCGYSGPATPELLAGFETAFSG